jgi:hypothetical protein
MNLQLFVDTAQMETYRVEGNPELVGGRLVGPPAASSRKFTLTVSGGI